jgi:hypothetical protein
MAGTALDRRSAGMIIVAIVAVLQAFLALFRAFLWFEISNDLSRHGLLMQIFGMMMFGRGILAVLIAALYGIFAWGLLACRSWARGLGLAVAVVNLTFAAGLAFAGREFVVEGLLEAIVPVIIIVYLLRPGRPAMRAVLP